MIITTVRHGRTKRDTKNLVAHLRKEIGQTSRVVKIGNAVLSNVDDAVRYMEMMRDGSFATVAMHHITISPVRCMSPEQIDETVRRILAAFGAEDHPYVLFEHDGKARSAKAADQHFHLILGHIGPDGKAIRDSGSFRKLEAVARSIEADIGEELTHSRRTAAVAAELRAMGRDDVANTLQAPGELPKSAMSSTTHAVATRAGVDLPGMQASVRAAWSSSDNAAAFRNAIAEQGLEIRPGKKPGVFVIVAIGDVEIGALDRIVRQRRAAVAARMEEEENERSAETARKAPEPRRSDLLRGPRGQRILGEPSTLIAAARRSRAPRTEPNRRDQRGFGRHDRDLGPSKSDPRAHRKHLRENLAIARLGGADFHALRARAKAVANGRDVISLHRRIVDRAAAASFRSLDFSDIKPIVMKMAAGEFPDHSELDVLSEVRRMKSLKSAKSLDLKTRLLAEISPHGFDVSKFSNDLHMVKVPSPGRSTARVMTRDGGWIEIDTRTGVIRTWGPSGMASVLAQALASHLGTEVQHLAKTVSVSADAAALHVAKVVEDQVKSLAMWWSARGYVVVPAADGCWIDAGSARIKDTGDRMEIHGGLTEEAINATLTKAQEAWNGGLFLDGEWTPAEQDAIWIAAQRRGIDIANCNPSARIQAAWAREQEAVATTTRTISAARSAVTVAADVKAAAGGDLEALERLPQPLQAFIVSHIDDDQRKHVAAQGVAYIIPALDRFRGLGANELAEYERRTGRKFVAPKPRRRDHDRDNNHQLDM